ncbi:Uncharacterised protein [Mycobacterium tuberculosis]|nr:Uncharacterised protein [Mycobacterium tuberculosis]
MRVAGERVQDHHHVVPCGRQNALPASMPPANSKDSTAPVPLGASLLARSCQGEEGSPA